MTTEHIKTDLVESDRENHLLRSCHIYAGHLIMDLDIYRSIHSARVRNISRNGGVPHQPGSLTSAFEKAKEIMMDEASRIGPIEFFVSTENRRVYEWIGDPERGRRLFEWQITDHLNMAGIKVMIKVKTTISRNGSSSPNLR